MLKTDLFFPPGVLFMLILCFPFMLPYCGNGVPDQGPIREKLFISQQNSPAPLLLRALLMFIQTGLCSVIRVLDLTLMTTDRLTWYT